MCQHTPEPWEETYNPSDNTWGVCLPEGGDVLAQLIENQADAHLMAAAPAMYEALQWAMQYLRMPNFHPDNSYNSEQWARDYNKLTDALAQAEGRG
jgi:hypothetical protein